MFTGSSRVSFTLLVAIGLVAALGLTAAAQEGTGASSTAVSETVARSALAQAERYADVTYEYRGTQEKGVAYKWGGRSSVDEYLAAVSDGAVPGKEVGADASAVVVNAYRSVDPGHRFAVSWGGGKRLATDATSADLYRWNVQPIPFEQMRPGDLIFFQDEGGDVTGVAIYQRRSGPNVHFIVASPGRGRVIRTFLNVNNSYWNTKVKAAGRLLAGPR